MDLKSNIKIKYNDCDYMVKGNILKIFICLVLLSLIIFSGCISDSSSNSKYSSASSYTTKATPTTSVEDFVEIESIDASRNEYDWLVFKGVIANDDSESHSVVAYIDVYDENDVKIDHLLIYENVDAHGKSAFEETSIISEDYDRVTYRWDIDDIY